MKPPPFSPSQNTPWEQLQCCLMGIRGWTMNVQDFSDDHEAQHAAKMVINSLDYIEENFPEFFKDVPWDAKRQAQLDKFLGRKS